MQPYRPLAAAWLILAGTLVAAGCGRYAPRAELPERAAQAGSRAGAHEHQPGRLGGGIATIGRDEYHAEAVFEPGGRLAVYTLGPDETRVEEVEQQVLTAYAKPDGSAESFVMLLKPDPVSGDSAGMTSRFTGGLPEQAIGKRVSITVPGLRIAGERFTLRFQSPDSTPEPAMPTGLDDALARDLYLTPGGLYTQADIQANGQMTAAAKYAGFRARHDFKPQPGDLLCPVTRTKANPQCTWIIGSQTYQFCCPPCIDEFLTVAKAQSDQVLPPEGYVKQP